MDPRLQPIERPANPVMRLAYWISARRFGRVLSPFRIIYARKPRLLILAAQIQRTIERLSLEPSIRLLVQVQAARLNGCAFCEDLALAEALRARVGADRFRALDAFRDSDAFSAREKAALAFAEEATRTRDVSDQTFAAVRAHFTDVEIVELAWVNAVESYFNLQAHPLRIGSDGLFDLAAARIHSHESIPHLRR